MSPLMMRFFTLVGIALAAASMQLKARADTPGIPLARQSTAAPMAQPACTATLPRTRHDH